jgi:hypothetical protein
MSMYRVCTTILDDGKLNSPVVRGKINYLTMHTFRSMYNNFSQWKAKQHVSAWEDKLLNNAYVSQHVQQLETMESQTARQCVGR